jgi:hypothetical protein
LLASIVFLSIGAGAVFQVVVIIAKLLGQHGRGFLTGPGVAGIAVGMLVIYLTALLI